MNRFTYALKQRNLEELRKYPKADLHNHFVLGGSRSFLYQAVGKKIEPLKNSLSSMGEMDQWSQKYIGQDFNSTEMRKLLIKATCSPVQMIHFRTASLFIFHIESYMLFSLK